MNTYGNNGYAVTQSSLFLSSQNYLTDVGAYSNSPGPFGTFDQGGDLFQWSENQTIRGGDWGGGDYNGSESASTYLDSTGRTEPAVPYVEQNNIGGGGLRNAVSCGPEVAFGASWLRC